MPNSSQYAKYKKEYEEKPDKYLKEKQRINEFIKNKYATDEDFREKCKEYQRMYRLSKSLSTTTST
jgi:hypothetical protein